MTILLNWLFVPLWCGVFCVAKEHPTIKLAAMIFAWLHVLLAVFSFAIG